MAILKVDIVLFKHLCLEVNWFDAPKMNTPDIILRINSTAH